MPERPATGSAPVVPTGERIGRAGRFNGRVALGVLLVLVAVIGGAIVLRRADATEPVLVAARDLASGVELQASDLRVVQVRMPAEQLALYARPGPDIVGSRLAAGVRQGAFVPVALLSRDPRAADLVDYPIPVEHAEVPELRPGDRVVVLVSFDNGPDRGQGAVLLESAEVVRVLRGNAALGGGNEIEAVEVRVPKDRLALVAGAAAGGRVSMARLAPGDPPPEAAAGTQGKSGAPGTGAPGTGAPGTGTPGTGTPGTGAPGTSTPTTPPGGATAGGGRNG